MAPSPDDDGSAAVSPGRDRLFVASVEKALRVLEVFAGEGRALSIGQLAEASGDNRSSVQRSVSTLTALGYLDQDPDTRSYRPAAKCLSVANAFLRSDWLVQRAFPVLMECHRATDETVNLTRLIDTDVMLVSRLPSRHLVSIEMHVGSRAPAFCTAPGRAILAFLPETEREAVLARSDIVTLTSFTCTDPVEIRRRIEAVHRKGYALQSQEMAMGDISVAAPVLDARGRAVAAVNVAVPTSRWTADRLEREAAPVVVQAARALTQTVSTRVSPANR